MKYLAVVFILFLASSCLAQGDTAKQRILHQIIERTWGPDFAVISAKLKLNVDVEHAYRQLDTLLSRPYGDMFWMYGCAGLYFATRDLLRPEYKQRIRECWKRFTPYRGDTENHFLMYYGSLLLMSEACPNLDGSEWFMRKSSSEIHAEATEYLNHWIDETARFGQVEFNSPRYDYYYITPLVLLSEYAQDSTMRTRCEMMLDLTLADYAVEYLNGSYCGAHSRVSDQAAIDPRVGEVRSYGEYFFEDSIRHILPDLAFAALGKYECPFVIGMIAHDRETPFENIETKRGRPTFRGTNVREATVRKYDYMTKDYCLGSMQGGLVQPIQQQSWSLVFAGSEPHNILFSLHPNFSADELGEFFPEEPSYILEKIGSTKAGYPNENKWVGGSAYERIYQNKNMLVAMYDIPDSAKFHHVDVYLPPNMQHVNFGLDLHGGKPAWTTFQYDSALVAVRMMTDVDFLDSDTHYRMRTTQGHTACWVICSSLREMSREEFERRVKPLEPKEFGDSVAYLDWNGNGIRCKRVDSVDYQPKEEWFYNSPFMKSKRGSGVISIEAHTRREGYMLDLDFQKNKILFGSSTTRN